MRLALDGLFARTAGLVLVVTGSAKVFSASGLTRALDTPDPLVGLRFAQFKQASLLTEIQSRVTVRIITVQIIAWPR